MNPTEEDFITEKLAAEKLKELREASSKLKMTNIEELCGLAIDSISKKRLTISSLPVGSISPEKMISAGVMPLDANFNYRFSRPWNPEVKVKRTTSSLFGIGGLSATDYENVTSQKVLDAPIIDICLILKNEVVPDGFYRLSRTPTNKKADLNSGSGGSHLFLCIKKAKDDDSTAPISSLLVIYPDKKEYVPPGFSVVKRQGKPCNINAGTSAERIFLCYKRDASCNPITDVQVYFPSKAEAPPVNFVRLTRSVRNYAVDLNLGTGAHVISICYRHHLKNLNRLLIVEKKDVIDKGGSMRHRSASCSASFLSAEQRAGLGSLSLSATDVNVAAFNRRHMEKRYSHQASHSSSIDLSEEWAYDRDAKKVDLEGNLEEIFDGPLSKEGRANSCEPQASSRQHSPVPHSIKEEGDVAVVQDEGAVGVVEDSMLLGQEVTLSEKLSAAAISRDRLDSTSAPLPGELERDEDNDSVMSQNSMAVDSAEQHESMVDMGMTEDRVVTIFGEPVIPLHGLILRAMLEGIFTTGKLFDISLVLLRALVEEVDFFKEDFEGHPSAGTTLLDVAVSALCERLDGCVEAVNARILAVLHVIIVRSKGILSKYSVQKLFRGTTFVCAAQCTRSNWVAGGYSAPVQDDGDELFAQTVLRDLIKKVTHVTEGCDIDHVLPSVVDAVETSLGGNDEGDGDGPREGQYHLEHLTSISPSYEIVVNLVTDFFDEVVDSVETSRVTEVALLSTAKKSFSTLTSNFWIHMNTIAKTLFQTYEVQNAFILLAALCKWSWLGIRTAESGEAAPRHLGTKLLAIESLRDYCRLAGPNMRVSKIMGYQIRRLVVSSIFVNIQYALTEPRIFSQLLKLVSILWENWREHIRLEFPVLCEQLIIKVLQAPPLKMPALYHYIVLKEVMKWFEQPHMSVEMFVNFDMDGIVVSDWNIFSHIIRAVCSLAEKSSRPFVPGQGTGPWPSEASNVGSDSTMFGDNRVPVSPRDVKIKALEVTAHITRAIMDATGHANLIYMDIIANDENESSSSIGGGWMTKGEDEDEDEDGHDVDGALPAEPLKQRKKSSSMINRRAVNIKSAELLQKALQIYKAKDSVAKAVKFLLAENFMSDTPHEIANFVRIYKDNFDPTAIGDFLGEGGRTPQEEQYMDMLRYRYTRGVSFVDTEVEDALRLYLTGCGFRMPGEAQKIDRFISAFVKVYWQDNRNTEFCPFQHEDTVHLLAYAAIMLNTDLHRANMDKKKSAKKMTKSEFVKNLRGADQGQDIDTAYLERIYDNIAAGPIEMAVDTKPTDDDKAQGKVQRENTDDNAATDPESNRACVRELLRSLRNSEDLLRSLSPYTHRFYIMGVDISISLDLVSFMFESVWHNFHAIVDSLLTKMINEENVIFSALDVLCNSLTSCIFLDLKVEKLAYATQLARFRQVCEAAESDEDGTGKGKISGAGFASGAFRKEKWFVRVEEATVQTAITAIAEVHGVVTQLKDVVRFCARREATKAVLTRIEKKANLKDSNRFIIMEGDLKKRNRSNKFDTYRFFLFSDCLVYAHQGFSEYKVHGQLDLESTTVDGYVPDDVSNCCFVVNNPKKSFLVMADSHAEKQNWLRNIQETISSATHRRNGRRLSILDRMESQDINVTERQKMHTPKSASKPCIDGDDDGVAAIEDHAPARWNDKKPLPDRRSQKRMDVSGGGVSVEEEVMVQRSPFASPPQSTFCCYLL